MGGPRASHHRTAHVWDYPSCPAGHGEIFVDRMNAGNKEFRCHAPWCDVETFDT